MTGMSLVQGQSLIIMMTIIEEQMTDYKKKKKTETGKRTMDNRLVLEIFSVPQPSF